jgi:hypothetical protein
MGMLLCAADSPTSCSSHASEQLPHIRHQNKPHYRHLCLPAHVDPVTQTNTQDHTLTTPLHAHHLPAASPRMQQRLLAGGCSQATLPLGMVLVTGPALVMKGTPLY